MAAFDISIAGELNLDLVLYGLNEDLVTERELLASDFTCTLGSSSSILAYNLAVLGARVAFVTKVGEDALGGLALDRLRETTIDLSHVVKAPAGEQTGVTVLLAHGARRRILTYPGVMATMTTDEIDVDYLSTARHFHLSSLFLQRGLWPGIADLFRSLKKAGLTLSLDTNDDPEDRWDGPLPDLLPLLDILLPNDSEACRMTDCDNVEEALERLAAQVPLVAIKCGKRGALVARGKERWTVPALSVTPVDTIGAGDSFNAGFLSGYLQGLPPAVCAEMGNATAALSTLRPGGTEAFRDTALREAFLSEHLPSLAVR
ncbi:Sugar or nucleoside kinase, ribokinase family [Bryocella elongata]|uniref:Sugar or nucleoside kinase, ribokinase family n=1 Tax=Bryocella elongata TaxID=863522 RepID=A0A1H5UEG4_9BACT|nr:carbohydrate kinase family protein [Bryocella elongata]SEF73380.1 Sugar or nucleoside kinase, ribokinase family [Bryocella elongata]